MMAASKKMLDQEPSEIEMLLPFHAAGTLNARDARRVEEALASDPELARQYAVIREEYAETIQSQREPRCAVRARHAEAVCRDRRRARAQAVAFGQPVRPDLGIFRKAVAAHAGLVGEPRRRGAAVAGRRDRRGADEEPDRFVPDRLAQPERAVAGPSPAISEQRRAAARAGAVCAGSAHRRHHRAARQLSGLDRRRRQGRHVPAAVRQQGDEQGRSRRPAEPGCSARRSSASRWQRRKARRVPRRSRGSMVHDGVELADEDAARGIDPVGGAVAIAGFRSLARFMRKASCARPTSMSGRGCPPSIRR